MPSMANVTVKAANGSTDVVFVAMAPSSGDKVPAVWRVDAASTVAAHRPQASIRASDNGSGTARRIELSAVFPYVPTPVGNEPPQVAHRIPFTFTFIIPKEIPDSVVAEAVHQFTNLAASTLVRDTLKSGYAPS